MQEQINNIYMISIILLAFAIFFFLLFLFLIFKIKVIDHFSISLLLKKQNNIKDKKKTKAETKNASTENVELWDETLPLDEMSNFAEFDESFDEEETKLLSGKRAKFEKEKDIIITH